MTACALLLTVALWLRVLSLAGRIKRLEDGAREPTTKGDD